LHYTSLIPWLSPGHLLHDFGSFAVLGVCLIIFVETAFLIGFLLPGDSLLLITGLLSFPGKHQFIHVDIWWVALAIGAAAFLGGEVGHFIGRKAGPRIFERKETGFFSRENVDRTNAFFERFGGFAIVVACFVPVIRTFAPVAAGVGRMSYRQYGTFNLIGAFLWAAVISVGGFLLGFIPPVADFVAHYIDIILLAAIVIAIVPTTYHYVRAARKARKATGTVATGTDLD
jgi:membrane-associated protein